MALNNILLHELVDRAVPPGGMVNCEALHKLLHVIVSNLDCPNPPKTDFKCTIGTKTAGVFDQKVESVSEKVKELRDMVDMQRKLISELHLKVQSLEKTSNGRGTSKKSLISVRSRSGMGPSKSSGEWTVIEHPGKVPTADKPKQTQLSTMNVRSMHSLAKDSIPLPRCVQCQQEMMTGTLGKTSVKKK